MWDVQLQRRAVMNEMRQMAARPFASVEMQLDNHDRHLLESNPTPVRIPSFYPLYILYSINRKWTLSLLGLLWNLGRRCCLCCDGANAFASWKGWCSKCRRRCCLLRICHGQRKFYSIRMVDVYPQAILQFNEKYESDLLLDSLDEDDGIDNPCSNQSTDSWPLTPFLSSKISNLENGHSWIFLNHFVLVPITARVPPSCHVTLLDCL